MRLVDALRGARAYDLEQPRFAGAPVWPAHEPGVILNLHRRHERDAAEARTSASAMLVMTEHSGTHIDALCHQAYDGRLHGGRRGRRGGCRRSTGFTALGIDTVAPIVARGVLLDVAPPGGRCRTATRSPRRTSRPRRRGSSCGAGDVVLVRLGSGALWADRAGVPAGGWDDRRRLALARRALARRRRRRQRRLGHPGRDDPELGSLPGHTILIVQAGIHIIESLFLEELAADGVREFALRLPAAQAAGRHRFPGPPHRAGLTTTPGRDRGARLRGAGRRR